MAARKETRKKADVAGRHQVVDHAPLFTRTNYLLMIAGGVVIALGMLLMAGGKSPDPEVFRYEDVYSARRITIAPLLIIAGLVLEIYAIFHRGRSAN